MYYCNFSAFLSRISMQIIFAFLVSITLVGCGSMLGSMIDPRVKVSSTFTTKVIEGQVAKVGEKDNPNLKKREIGVTDVAITNAAANNIGNTSTGGKLLALDIAIDFLNHQPEKIEFYTVVDDNSGENIEIIRSYIYPLGKPGASVGDKIRLIYGQAGLLAVYNLTTNPGLDEKTR